MTLRRLRQRRAGAIHEVRGVGTVVAMINTGEGARDERLVHLVLRVDADGLDVYDATTSAKVPSDLLRMLKPGVRVAVRVDPGELDRPVVDLSRVWITPSVASP